MSLGLAACSIDGARAYRDEARAYIAEGDYAGAIADLDQANRLEPDYTFAYHWRGWVYENMGEWDKAIADYQQAADLFKQEGDLDGYQEMLDDIKDTSDK